MRAKVCVGQLEEKRDGCNSSPKMPGICFENLSTFIPLSLVKDFQICKAWLSQLISDRARTVQHQVPQKFCFCSHYPPDFWRVSICGTVAWDLDLQQLCMWLLCSLTPITSTVTPWPECMFTGNLLMHIYWCTLLIFIFAKQSSLEIAGFCTTPIFPHTTLFYLKHCRKPYTLRLSCW